MSKHQFIYDKETQNKKLELLEANCKSKEQQMVQVDFSEDDLSEMKSRLSEIAIEKDELEVELKELSKGLRDKIKEKNGKLKGLLVHLRNKYDLQMQTVYEFDNQEDGLMLTYNAQGELINSRKLRPAERQTRIIPFESKKQA